MNITPRSRPGKIGITIRILIVAFVYSAATALAAVIIGPLSRLSPSLDNFFIWLLTGTLVASSVTPFVLNSNSTRKNTILSVWAVLALVQSLGLGIEGLLFKPTAAINATVAAFVGIFVNLLVAWAVVTLLMPTNQKPQESAKVKRSWWGWAWRVIVVGLAYFIFYFIFGATNAILYTLAFYRNNPQYGLSIPPTGILFLAELIRAPLFGLGSMFILRTTSAPRKHLAIWVGILLYVIGGISPYLEVTFRTMPIGFNLATLLELFFQNFLTGVVAANLFIPKDYMKNNRKT